MSISNNSNIKAFHSLSIKTPQNSPKLPKLPQTSRKFPEVPGSSPNSRKLSSPVVVSKNKRDFNYYLTPYFLGNGTEVYCCGSTPSGNQKVS